MLRHIFCLVLLFVSLSSAILSAEPSSPPFEALVGTWEARYQAYSGGVETDLLMIVRTDKNLSGTYRGYEAEDHGPWYYFVRMQQLVIGQDGIISFAIGPRNLYASQPTSTDEPSDLSGGTRPGTGRTESSFRLTGSIWDDGALHLSCASDSQTCPFVQDLVFKKREEKG